MMVKCLFLDGEPTEDAVVVKGIVRQYGFHPTRICENAEAIASLLFELPDEFQRTKGGGWSFLNACVTKDGEQWTELHQRMECLFALGLAAGRASWLFPRSFWSALPGGMPYVVVN